MKKGEKRKQELLKIAYWMFLEKGYENTSVDEIIEAAGIAKGTYYYYFESKEQTLEEVIDMMLDAETAKADAIMAADISIPEKLIGIVSSFRPDVSEAPIRDTLNSPENLLMHEKINRRLNERIIPIISRLVEEGGEQGIFSCGEIPQRVKMIIILSRELFDEEGYTEADIDVFIDVVEKMARIDRG